MAGRNDIGSREDRRSREWNWKSMAQVRSGMRCRGRHKREDMIGSGRGISNKGQGKAFWEH